jgi:CheY-like chemotaxis protein
MSPQVLLVEDDDSIREGMVEVVEGEGYTVASAANGHEALRWLEGAPDAPAVILLDLMMPGMNGVEFLEHLRALADESKRETPVIVLTASRYRPEGPGIAAALRKPVDLDALLALIHGFARTSA